MLTATLQGYFSQLKRNVAAQSSYVQVIGPDRWYGPGPGAVALATSLFGEAVDHP